MTETVSHGVSHDDIALRATHEIIYIFSACREPTQRGARIQNAVAEAIRSAPFGRTVTQSMTVQSCENCKFRIGLQCRKSPPVRLPRAFAQDATAGNRVRDEQLIWGWPTIEARDWCGEWRGDYPSARNTR